MILVLVMSLFLVSIVPIVTPAEATGSNHIVILAKGDDMDITEDELDIYRATTLIVGKIKFDKVSDVLLGRVEFLTTIYDESGEKVYSIKGKLKDGVVMLLPQYYCPVRNVIWVNVWAVMGIGMIKTTDIDLQIEYRGGTITLPNTKGKYETETVMMLVSPNGEIENPNGGNLEVGGWAFAGIPGFGGVTSLKIYKEI